jgi:hypothetical protein
MLKFLMLIAVIATLVAGAALFASNETRAMTQLTSGGWHARLVHNPGTP